MSNRRFWRKKKNWFSVCQIPWSRKWNN